MHNRLGSYVASTDVIKGSYHVGVLHSSVQRPYTYMQACYTKRQSFCCKRQREALIVSSVPNMVRDVASRSSKKANI
jgi:hypothetical protein